MQRRSAQRRGFQRRSIQRSRTSQMNLTPPAPEAKSLTLTAVKMKETGAQMRSVTTEELRRGVRLWTSDLGGFAVEDYQAAGGVISFELMPFGWSEPLELIPEEPEALEEVSAEGGLHSGLVSELLDPQTGRRLVRMDYYAAKDEQLEAIAEWRYCWYPAELDTKNSITLPLVPMER